MCICYDLQLTEQFLKDRLTYYWKEFPDSVLHDLRYSNRSEEIKTLAYSSQQRQLAEQIRARMKNPAEINRDEETVKRRLNEYSFPSDLNEILNKISDELVAGGDKFDQAANLKHLRTFFEKLHEQVGQTLRARKPETLDGTDLSSCGQAIEYLDRKSVLTEKMKSLGKALYGVLSNEGVHALKSEKEYSRLCRNMVIEYAIVLFFELERQLAAP